MSKTRNLYIAPVMMRWERLSVQLFGIPETAKMAKTKGPKNSPGLMVVFESMEALREVYPDVDESTVMVMTVSTEGNNA